MHTTYIAKTRWYPHKSGGILGFISGSLLLPPPSATSEQGDAGGDSGGGDPGGSGGEESGGDTQPDLILQIVDTLFDTGVSLQLMFLNSPHTC